MGAPGVVGVVPLTLGALDRPGAAGAGATGFGGSVGRRAAALVGVAVGAAAAAATGKALEGAGPAA